VAEPPRIQDLAAATPSLSLASHNSSLLNDWSKFKRMFETGARWKQGIFVVFAGAP
jgi:hypothetical protein